MLITTPTITAGDSTWRSLSEDDRDELRALSLAHGFDPCEVQTIEHSVIDCPLLRFTLYTNDERGHRLRRPGTDELAMRTAERALTAPLPAWWHPHRAD